MRFPKPVNVNCPACGAPNPSNEEYCSACRHTLTVYIGPARVMPGTYSVGSLMLIVAVVALGTAAARVNVVLGVEMLLVSVPATFRVITVTAQKREDSMPFSFTDQAYVFITSLMMLMLVFLCAGLAWGMTLMLAVNFVPSTPVGAAVAVSVSAPVGLFVAYLLLKRTWPYRG